MYPRGKGRADRGMTLVETLLALLLITMLTAVLLAGSQAAFQVYVKNSFVADSQTVSDTIVTALSDVLRYATQVETDAAGAVTAYTSTAYQVTGEQITIGADAATDGMIFLDGAQTIPLLSDLSYSNMQVTEFALTYEDGVFTCSYRLRDISHSLTSELFTCSLRTLGA